MSDKPESKQSQIVSYLRSGAGDDETVTDIAARFECNEGTVRRARKIVDAERHADTLIEQGASSEDAAEVLRAILSADALEETVRTAIEDVLEELKELKASYKDSVAKGRSVRKMARENHPLFDRPVLSVRSAVG